MPDTTILINPQEIRQLFQPRTSNFLRLQELAQQATFLAILVEESWEKLSPQEQELLKLLAYEQINSIQTIGDLLRRFINRVCLAWSLTQQIFSRNRRLAYSLIEYWAAGDRLINAILSAIERENPAYQQALCEAIAVVPKTGKAMTAEEAASWIREISYQAIEEP